MRQIFSYLLVSLATFIIGITTAMPWTASRTTSESQDKQEILRIEQQYLDAHVRRDTAALDRILAEDFTFSYFRGRVADKAVRLALLESSDFTFQSIDTRNVEVGVNGDTAHVMGEAVVHGSYLGKDFVTAPYSYLRTYERRDGRWQIVSVLCGRSCAR